MANEELESSASDQLSLGEAPKFLCGVAVSVYQNSGAASPPIAGIRGNACSRIVRAPGPASCTGDPNSQWKAFEEQKAAHVNVNLRLSAGALPEWDTPSASGDGVVAATWENLGPSKIVGDQRIGVASDFWNRYEEDIQLAKDIRARPQSLPPNHRPPRRAMHAEVACLVRRLQQLPAVHRVEPPVPAPGRAQPGRRGALQRNLRHAGAVRATTIGWCWSWRKHAGLRCVLPLQLHICIKALGWYQSGRIGGTARHA